MSEIFWFRWYSYSWIGWNYEPTYNLKAAPLFGFTLWDHFFCREFKGSSAWDMPRPGPLGSQKATLNWSFTLRKGSSQLIWKIYGTLLRTRRVIFQAGTNYWKDSEGYPLVIRYIAIEHGIYTEVFHERWWFSSSLCQSLPEGITIVTGFSLPPQSCEALEEAIF